MSTNPTTFQGEPGDLNFDWNDAADLQRAEDGGVLRRFQSVRRGTVAELVNFVMSLPEADQELYAIQKSGDARLEIATIRALASRPGFPKV